MSNQKNISRYCESEGGEEKAREKRREEGKEEGRHRGGSLQDGAEEKKNRCLVAEGTLPKERRILVKNGLDPFSIENSPGVRR